METSTSWTPEERGEGSVGVFMPVVFRNVSVHCLGKPKVQSLCLKMLGPTSRVTTTTCLSVAGTQQHKPHFTSILRVVSGESVQHKQHNLGTHALLCTVAVSSCPGLSLGCCSQ